MPRALVERLWKTVFAAATRASCTSSPWTVPLRVLLRSLCLGRGGANLVCSVSRGLTGIRHSKDRIENLNAKVHKETLFREERRGYRVGLGGQDCAVIAIAHTEWLRTGQFAEAEALNQASTSSWKVFDGLMEMQPSSGQTTSREPSHKPWSPDYHCAASAASMRYSIGAESFWGEPPRSSVPSGCRSAAGASSDSSRNLSCTLRSLPEALELRKRSQKQRQIRSNVGGKAV
ncbi:uncharacterized protein PAC_15495 [Phialocephala subalpina]|uniref:Uncharacterized protein n=1 Tax=Phialocephala subalpina TaxID=576137 RepID=A0A1L7XKK7_9HELO|nr:uncharacterized protein PAC_15495 [Phialocephala subalpina]